MSVFFERQTPRQAGRQAGRHVDISQMPTEQLKWKKEVITRAEIQSMSFCLIDFGIFRVKDFPLKQP